jgi:nucleotide-binding universal stress UspA family protein
MNEQPVPAGSITVGIDGSACAGLALDWAVAEATRRGLPLHIVHAFSYQYPMTSQGGMGFVIEGVREIAEDLCQKAEERVQTTHPDLPVTWEVSTYGAASALVDASRTSHTVVVGARGVSAARGVLLGSVSTQVAAHSHCPVVVIHDGQPAAAEDAPVVVGVDGSALSMNAIAYAFEEASSRGVGLTAVHAWWLDYVEGASASAIWTVDWKNMAQEENALVAESLAGWQEKYPDVAITRDSVHGHPVEALVRHSENACLVVVGSRGRGGFRGLLLGSVSQGVVHRAQCPVAIIRAPHQDSHHHGDGAAEEHRLPVPPVREHD